MNRLERPTIPLPADLSDEGLATILYFLGQLSFALDAHYAARTVQRYADRPPTSAEPRPDHDRDPPF